MDCVVNRAFKQFEETVVEEQNYIVDEDFDWMKVYKFCSLHLNTITHIAENANLTEKVETTMSLMKTESQDAKLLTEQNALRLIKNQIKNLISKYNAQVDYRVLLPVMPNFDSVLEPVNKVRYVSDFEANL